jgi:hypothetical protein
MIRNWRIQNDRKIVGFWCFVTVNTQLHVDNMLEPFFEHIPEDSSICVKSQILMMESMKMIAFWDIAPCCLEVEQCFVDACCLHYHHSDNGGSLHL